MLETVRVPLFGEKKGTHLILNLPPEAEQETLEKSKGTGMNAINLIRNSFIFKGLLQYFPGLVHVAILLPSAFNDAWLGSAFTFGIDD